MLPVMKHKGHLRKLDILIILVTALLINIYIAI